MNGDRFADIIIISGILVVLGLKIAGIITIPWVWLLSPLWILFGLGVILAVCMTIMCLISGYINKRRKDNERY